ncbi:MAG: UTP--glucose-1-phosphate uridylyltransferase GalU [Bdellovibrionales bacterium]|nr:UTP--glucose-1-phosphate uridylyltransferase GalU [Bdellovibrionales bacterium]
MNKVKKALIPAAGLGTRFLPATKTIPKEMLPIVDQPILLYIVEEAVRAGIEDIILVSGRGKSAIEDFFDCSYEVEDLLSKTGKVEMVDRLKNIRNMANIISIRQKEALGLGHAVACGSPIIGKDNFAVLLGDEIMYSAVSEPTVTEQLTNVFSETGLSTVAVMQVEPDQVEKYGIVAGEKNSAGQIQITDVVEKPKKETAPSRYALPGRYVFTAQIFDSLKNAKPGKNGEIQLTDAMTDVAKKYGMLGSEFKAKRFDAGDKLGYLMANIEIALMREDLSSDLRTYLKKLVPTL